VTRGRGPHVRVTADRARVELAGTLDLDTREAFLRAIRELPDVEGPVEIDLRAVGFLDSTGLSSLIAADRALVERSGRRPRILVADSGPVLRMLQLTLLHLTLDVRAA
jgi:anti-anti-sigma factor